MKGLILAGGNGSRLRPLTNAMPKQLIPVAGRPVLFHGLEALAQAGVTDVAIVVGGWGAQIRKAVGDGGAFGLRVAYLHQEAPFGLAHCVMLARDFLGDDPFLMHLGDIVVLGDDVTRLADHFLARPADAELLVAPVADARAYGVAELDRDGRVVGLAEKPPAPRSGLALIGVYAFGPAVHEAVAAVTPSRRGELEITDAIQRLVERGGDIRARVLTGYWRDTGSVDDLLHCNRRILEGLSTRLRGRIDRCTEVTSQVEVAEGADVSRSRLAGPLVIGTGSRVTGARIGPHTSIGAGCLIEDAGIGHSIVLDGESVVGRRIDSAVVGHGITLAATQPGPVRAAANGAVRISS